MPWLSRGNRDLDRCSGCGFAWMRQGVKRASSGLSIYADQTPIFAGDEQADYYRDETAEDAAREKLAWVRRFVPHGASLLDVGANFGLFVKAASTDLQALGIEPSPGVVEQARAAGAPIDVGSIDEAQAAFDGRFDALTLFDVIEHLPDPERAVRHCHRYLKPGGHLFITTPDFSSGMARLLGRHWYYVDMDEHIALFTRANLRDVLMRNGFEVIERQTIGRGYRLSYIRRRLAYLGRGSLALRAVAAAAGVLAFWPRGRIRINLGDVMGVVARRT